MLITLQDDGVLRIYRSVEEGVRDVEALDAEEVFRSVFDESFGPWLRELAAVDDIYMDSLNLPQRSSKSTNALAIALCILCFFVAATNAQTASPRAVASDDNLKVTLGNKVLLESERDGFMSVHRIVYSPRGKHFVVIGCGFECTDNIGFLFRANGTGKRKFTARWDVILQEKLEWSTDGTKIYYFRINSTGADPPKTAPPESWVVVDVATGRKGPATTRRLDQRASYSVFNTGDGLVVRAAPGVNAKEVGRLASDAKGVRVTGPGKLSGRALWVPIKHNGLSGWVNQNFLFRQ